MWIRGGASLRHPVPPDARLPLSTVDGPEQGKQVKRHLRSLVTLPRILAASPDQRRASQGTSWLDAVGSRKQHYDTAHILHPMCCFLITSAGTGRWLSVLFAIQWFRWGPSPHLQSSAPAPPGLTELGCIPRTLQQSPAATPPGVLGTWPSWCNTLAVPLVRQVPDNDPRDGPQIQIATASMRSPEAFCHPIVSRRFGSRLRFRKPFFLYSAKRARPPTSNALAAPSDAAALGGFVDARAARRRSGLKMQKQGASIGGVDQALPLTINGFCSH
jgi:hypothetical protein